MTKVWMRVSKTAFMAHLERKAKTREIGCANIAAHSALPTAVSLAPTHTASNCFSGLALHMGELLFLTGVFVLKPLIQPSILLNLSELGRSTLLAGMGRSIDKNRPSVESDANRLADIFSGRPRQSDAPPEHSGLVAVSHPRITQLRQNHLQPNSQFYPHSAKMSVFIMKMQAKLINFLQYDNDYRHEQAALKSDEHIPIFLNNCLGKITPYSQRML